MIKLLLLLIALPYVEIAVFKRLRMFPREKCQKLYEEFDECKSLCPETCMTLNDTSPCFPGCAKGCNCKFGYVRNEDNNCIKIEDCSGSSSSLMFPDLFNFNRADKVQNQTTERSMT
ncbi:hypothetical protein ILUMI_25490 [Ignelater luminosus]|uniref:TIL domain-containing protein n=1 Tax=Ignelater luminosus TaxID=2038154 RepID=A0A8K0C8F0_IGNLU|nr:hypothetical protein ILUMI_25490 [Ignelater luminosus]